MLDDPVFRHDKWVSDLQQNLYIFVSCGKKKPTLEYSEIPFNIVNKSNSPFCWIYFLSTDISSNICMRFWPWNSWTYACTSGHELHARSQLFAFSKQWWPWSELMPLISEAAALWDGIITLVSSSRLNKDRFIDGYLECVPYVLLFILLPQLLTSICMHRDWNRSPALISGHLVDTPLCWKSVDLHGAKGCL
jgi:hypothetical protein